MKKIIYIFLIFLVLSFTVFAKTHGEKYKIGVFFWHEAEHDYKTFEGIKEGFAITGIDCEYDIQKAFSNEDKVGEIIKKWVKERPDLIYTLGTGSTKRIMKEIKDIPIVFSAVTNPVLSGITPSWKSSGRNITGNSNWIPTENILHEFKNIIPSLTTLGVMYDADNSVSSMEVKSAKRSLESIGLQLISLEIETTDALIAATKTLVAKKVDALWIPIDILVYSNIDKIRRITDPAKIPLVSSSHKEIKEGAIIGLVVNYHNLGQLSVPIALKILTKDVAPKDIAIGTMYSHRRIINLKAAKEIHYDIPLEVLAIANEIIK